MPHALERHKKSDPSCLQCEASMPSEGANDVPADGWLVGVLYRRAESRKSKRKVRDNENAHEAFELSLCPDHGLYTTSKQPELGTALDLVPLKGPKNYPRHLARCAHCKADMPLDVAEEVAVDVILSPGWGFARVQRWTTTRIFNLTFYICPAHTLCGGEKSLKPKPPTESE